MFSLMVCTREKGQFWTFIVGMKNNETKEMLLQQGLDDIAHSSTSEQIAYLLVERARLMDELEAEQNQMQIDTPDGAMSASQIYKSFGAGEK